MPRRLQCELICEDAAQERLFRPILKHLFGSVRVAARKPQGGVGFVLRQVQTTNGYLRRRRQEKVGALVVVDGDDFGLEARRAEIVARVGKEEIDERMVTVVPCRAVETWILWLCGRRDLDETTEYKDRFRHEEDRGTVTFPEAVEAWLSSAPRTQAEVSLEKARLPALSDARAQLEKLKKLSQRG